VLTSYSQNFEDVILWRALKHIKNGFYIDVGAQDPVVDSVSRAFYQNGWRGVHAEATTHYANKVRRDRPDELVIQAAIGVGEGLLRFFEIPETGLSTSSYDIAMNHRAAGHKVTETEVPLVPLSAVFEQAGNHEIHWLKIDVEGMEQSVIESWPPSQARPWIVVVESTLPNSQIAAHDAWEPMLLSLGYSFAYFDGLSRFYVSEKHPELRQAFGPGPNFFDYFVLADTSPFVDTSAVVDAERKLLVLTKEVTEKEIRLEAAQRELNDLHAQLDKFETIQHELEDLYTQFDRLRTNNVAISAAVDNERFARAAAEAALVAMRSSHSWRFTVPLRYASKLVRYLWRGSKAWISLKPGSRPIRMTRMVVAHAVLWVRRRPRIARMGLAFVRSFPPLERRLRRFDLASRNGFSSSPGSRSDLEDNDVLTPRGLAVLADIQNEIGKENK
jgi:FkbM family methyltransferase